MAENAQTVYPVVRYRDAKAAIVWLVTTLGFVEHEVHPGEGDEIAHAQLAFGGGLIMLGSAREGSSIGETTVYMATADADVAYERARAVGQTSCTSRTRPTTAAGSSASVTPKATPGASAPTNRLPAGDGGATATPGMARGRRVGAADGAGARLHRHE